jgi:hypothetical protein
MDTGGAAESIGEERFGDSEPPRWHDRRVEFNEVPRFAEDDFLLFVASVYGVLQQLDERLTLIERQLLEERVSLPAAEGR